MSKDDRQRDDVVRLAADLHDGLLDAAGLERLRGLLAKDAASRDVYVDYTALHVLLASRHEPALQAASAMEIAVRDESSDFALKEEPTSAVRTVATLPIAFRSRHRLMKLVALAAMLLVAATLPWWLGSSAQPKFVAVLTDTSGAEWFANPPGVAPTRLAAGCRLQLTAGLAELTFSSGAVVVIKGPAELELVSPMCVRAARGAVRARVGSDATGFVIQTPTADVVDLGTEFGVDVNEVGATDVVVFDGAVVLSYDVSTDITTRQRRDRRRASSGDATMQLKTGEAVHVGLEGRVSRIVSVDSERFPVRAGGSRVLPVDPVIVAVHDNIPAPDSSQYYHIVHGGLSEDSRVYVDRRHEYNGVDEVGLPEFLLGADYVQTFNADKWREELEISVTLAQPAELFVIYDNRLPVPTWLSAQFVDTGYDVGIDELMFTSAHPGEPLAVGPGKSINTVHSVWRRVVEKPGVVTLGPIGDHAPTVSMYGLAARPLRPLRDDPPAASMHAALNQLAGIPFKLPSL
ncbi:MAG: hypothetical protein CMJ58_00490 [Planctomycetaceae bacterium]|nr:hypothetical protein [Planctomycetaceae bacterium]